ncbi:MAG TPA: hypothetical protein VK277_17175 [Acidimicrobiales bacterium]|nr:hypothetical protein [Acidimicrobiales bacterium]
MTSRPARALVTGLAALVAVLCPSPAVGALSATAPVHPTATVSPSGSVTWHGVLMPRVADTSSGLFLVWATSPPFSALATEVLARPSDGVLLAVGPHDFYAVLLPGGRGSESVTELPIPAACLAG